MFDELILRSLWFILKNNSLNWFSGFFFTMNNLITKTSFQEFYARLGMDGTLSKLSLHGTWKMMEPSQVRRSFSILRWTRYQTFSSNEKKAPGCLGFIGDDILPNAGTTTNHEIRIPIQQPCKDYNEASEFGSENSAEMRPRKEKEFVSLCHLFF